MSIVLTYGSLDMSSEVQGWTSRLARRVAGEDVENRHGQYVAGRAVLAPRTITVQGAIKQSSEANVRSRLSAYEVALAHGDAAALSFYNDKYINARCVDSSFIPTPGNPLRYAFDIEFYCDDPFWYDAAQTTDARYPSSSPLAWTHNYGGTYLIYPVLTVVAAAGESITNPRFTNSTISRYIQYDGTLAATYHVTFDCAKMQVKIGSPAEIGSLVAAFTGTFLWLLPGNNSMSFSYSGAAPASISIVYRKRYYQA